MPRQCFNRVNGRAETSQLLDRAMTGVSLASDAASRHGFEGTQQDLDQIFIELLRVQSSLLTFRRRAYRSLPDEAAWSQPPLPFG